MTPRTLCLLGLAGLAGCSNSLRGPDGFLVGRAQVVPCADESGDQGALVVLESFSECWIAAPEERPTCEQRRAQLAQNPSFCSPDLVISTPSQATLTGYMGAPFDPTNYLAASTTRMLDLPCNPNGPFAQEYPGFENAIVEYQGEVRVVRDRGEWGRLEVSLSRPGDSEPTMEGTVDADFCR